MKRYLSFLAILSIMSVLFACGGGGSSDSGSPTPTPTPTGTARPVNGVATNPVGGTPIAGATVSAFVQLGSIVAKTVAATATATATTNADGSYTITGLTAGVTYYFEITAAGYATFTYYNINPDATNNLTLENARVLPASVANQTATASGTVKNASTNAGLPGMTVKIRSGVNNTTGTVRDTATTDTTGAYSFAALSAGTYTAEVSGNIGTTPIITSYFTLVSIPGTTLNTNQDFPVTTATAAGQYKIVLNWGNDPSDLDSHLTGPAASATGSNSTTGTRFHVAFTNHSDPSGTATSTTSGSLNYYTAGATTEVLLDVDNTIHGSSTGADNGPETTSILVPHAGKYNFFVHHYSGSSNISASGAQVKVYKGNALLATYNPPSGATGSGDVWAVFSMTVSGSGQTITPVNTIFAGAGTSNLDGLIGSGSGGTFTDKLTVGTGASGTSLTGEATSFTRDAAGSVTLYYRVESATGGLGTVNGTSTGVRFVRLYINTLEQKDSTAPIARTSNVNIDTFRVSNPGTYTLKAYYVDPTIDIGHETLISTTTVTVN